MLGLICFNCKIRGLDKEFCISKTIGYNNFIKEIFDRTILTKVRTY